MKMEPYMKIIDNQRIRMNINFYWKNPDTFQFLNRLVILSHIAKNHTCIMWTDTSLQVNNSYWINNISCVQIRDIKDICDTSDYEMQLKQNGIDEMRAVRLTGDLWRFHLCLTGETYCDCDIFCLQNWDKFKCIITSDDQGEHFTVALIRPLEEHKKIFEECINVRGIFISWK